MSKIVREIFNHKEFEGRPPVLVDIGASGEIHDVWKVIAPYSICLAFDADTRDFSVDESGDSGFFRLFRINRIVSDKETSKSDFWLTKYPHCSSSLEPDVRSVSNWAFGKYFEVEEKIQLSSVTLEKALDSCGLDYIDYFKTDSQGTDLRIFASLPDRMQSDITVAEFEPGIIDAYQGEDKLHSLMSFMDEKPFWVQDMKTKGSHRIRMHDFERLNGIQKKFIAGFIPMSPGWCEISYFNSFSGSNNLRNLLLGWIFAINRGEFGFAFELISQAKQLSDDPIIQKIENYTNRKLFWTHGSFVRKGFLSILKRLFSRVG